MHFIIFLYVALIIVFFLFFLQGENTIFVLNCPNDCSLISHWKNTVLIRLLLKFMMLSNWKEQLKNV